MPFKINLLSVIRAISLLLTFFTGCTALVYEVTWHYYLANLLGSQARSTSIIVATFLGGLSVGYALCGRFSRRSSARTLVKGCGYFEVLIGVWAIAFPLIYGWVFDLRFVSGLGEAGLFYDMVVAAVLIGLPTMLMGASLPFLTQGLSLNVQDAGPFHARIYIVNTLGAFAGAFSAGFVLIPRMGLSATMWSMGVVNLIAGTIFVLLGQTLPRAAVSSPSVEADEAVRITPPQRMYLIAALAFLGGLISITLQTVLVRVIALSVGASTYAFAMVVSAFILVLALGAFLLAERKDTRVSILTNQILVVVGLFILYHIVPYLPYWSHVWRSLLTSQTPSFWVYFAGVFAVVCLVIAVPVGALGANLPILFREVRDRAESLGDRVGFIYGVNTVGCVLGAIIGGYLSLYYFDLDGVLKLCIAGACFSMALAALSIKDYRRVFAFTVAVLIGLGAYFSPGWPKAVMGRGTFRMTEATSVTYSGWKEFYREFASGFEIVGYKDDPNSTIAVVDTGGARSIVVNGKSDGSTRGGDRVTTKLLAHIPALLQSSTSDRAAVVGFGTGITVGSLAKYDEIKAIDVLEISHAVRNLSPLFDNENGGSSKNPKLQWHMGDAYRFLLETPHKYAVIVSEPSNPWVGGVERLYSKDFYDLARSKLAPGGIYAQWFHGYSISRGTLNLVLNTFKSTFPHVHVFERSSDLILIGSSEKIDTAHLDLMRERHHRDVISEDLKDIEYEFGAKILGLESWIPWDTLKYGPVQTLDRPKLSYWAGRDFFMVKFASPSEYAEDKKFQAASKRAFWDTLLAEDVKAYPRAEKIQILTMGACGVPGEDLADRWDKAPYQCRAGLVALTVLGKLEPNSAIPASVVELFTSVDPESTVPLAKADSVEEVTNGLDWIRNYGAPYLKVDPKKVRAYAASCFGPFNESNAVCREKLVLALTANSHASDAREELEKLTADTPHEGPFVKAIDELTWIVNRSE